MKITLTHITNLLKLFEKGLISGAGQNVNHFCVQQAVHRVLDDELNHPHKSDHPPSWCVREQIVRFGICLNDQSGWDSNYARAKGLQRFAIAELGSNNINSREFFVQLGNRLAETLSIDPDNFSFNNIIIDEFMSHSIGGMTKNDRLTFLANTAANVLRDLGTEGAQFLYILDEPDRKKRDERARALGHKIYAAQLADDASHCSFGLPQAKHHHVGVKTGPADK